MNPLRLYAKWLIAVLLAAVPSQLLAQNTAFIYQGRLTDGGSPANGLYDFQFSLYEFVTQVGATITVEDQQVTNGLLTVRLDFGSDVFTGLDLSLADWRPPRRQHRALHDALAATGTDTSTLRAVRLGSGVCVNICVGRVG